MKNKKAVAIEYSGDIPTVIAKAQGILVNKVLEIAENHDIPVFNDNDLTEVLSGLDINKDIPETLFKAIAEVLAFCYNINKKFKDKIDNKNKKE